MGPHPAICLLHFYAAIVLKFTVLENLLP